MRRCYRSPPHTRCTSPHTSHMSVLWLLASLLLLLLAADAETSQRAQTATQTDWKADSVRVLQSFPFMNHSLPLEVRVRDLVSRLSTLEKLAQLGVNAPAVSRLGIGAFMWGHEALHGCVNEKYVATVFPQPVGLGATWDAPLMNQVGEAVSDEGRALVNHVPGAYGLSVWAPNANMVRDPRWGRGHETMGEDPFLVGAMQTEFVKGLQGGEPSPTWSMKSTQPIGPRYAKLIATPKHFAAYDLEVNEGMSRHEFNAIVSRRDMNDFYLPVFQVNTPSPSVASCKYKLFQEAGARGTMCSYNSINSVPSCANSWLLNDTLREAWGFEGHVVSDCGAINDVYQNHHYSSTLEQGAADSLRAGTDLDCGGAYTQALNESSIQRGVITEAELDAAMTHLFANRLLLGEFDPPDLVPYQSIPLSVVDSAAHRQLALDVARESIVLLKNDDNLLPIDTATTKKILVVGPSANFSEILLGNYHGTPSFTVTPLAGIQAIASALGIEVEFAQGVALTGDGIYMMESVVASARDADLVIACFGLSALKTTGEEIAAGMVSPAFEKESMDRYTLRLPGVQRDIIKSIRKQTETPIVSVLINGGGVDVSWQLSDQGVNAIIEAWYGGEAAGAAIADVLFGRYAPAGRLPVTFYPESYLDQIGEEGNMNLTTGVGRTYRYLQVPPVLPFGFGLHYTEFEYSGVNVSPVSGPASASRTLNVTVSNTGKTITSDVVVPVFLSTDAVPWQEFGKTKLVAFTRLHNLAPGASVVASLTLDEQSFTYTAADGSRQVTPGQYIVHVEGQQAKIELS